ncbi:MFS transporter [Gracilibacillus sp. S3-1-1]|uniref:MFS transporter n=1 Tax=Gracilibacillus pellucidus TaxID=3095368 RepID=A0ACC6M8E5_9BACI|nr:MFS transporter [Gracilibacillus sp. S3-1-1]MDX8047219.1 MFS transporter [Gracilibacillus sp. S3-1-1]
MGSVYRDEQPTLTSDKTVTPVGNNIRFQEKFGYGLGDFASNLVFAAVSSFLLFYYTDIAGASAAIVGTILLVSRILDGFTDIGMGALVDKTNTKHGKARPWLMWMAIPYAISAFLLFTVPDFGPVGMLIYIAITYNVVHVIYTAINIPYGVLNARITQDQYERSTLNIFRMFMAMVANLIILNLTIPLVEMLGGGKQGWSLTFAIFGILAGIIFLITFATTKERVTAVQQTDATIPFKSGFQSLMKNKYWGLALLFALVTYTANGLNGGLGVYYADYILQNPALVGPLGLAGLLPAMIGLLFVAPIIKRFGKRNAMIAGMLFGLLGTVVILIDPASFTFVLVGSVIRGIGGIPVAASFFAMLADTIEYGEWKTGIRAEGLVYSAGSFGTKVGMGLGAAIMGWCLSLSGYVGGAVEQSSSATSMIIFLFVWVPVIFTVIQLIILAFYKLDKIYPKLLEELQARKGE